MIIEKRKILLIVLFGLLLSPVFVQAAEVGEVQTFYVDSDYDAQQREEVKAELRDISNKAYFYIEKGWYDKLEQDKKEKIEQYLEDVGEEFDEKIYPKMREAYGKEWSPGIDNDSKITILFHQLKNNSAGYFRSNDEYEKIRVPDSNEREMSYLNTKYLTKDILKSYIAHEFTHIITFNQKNRLRNVQEEVWLNEARAEYAPTLMGYDSELKDSNLQQRIRTFLNFPSDSIIDWQGRQSDYGVLRVFTQYLVDHYGKEILIDSLQTGEKGIEAVNYALRKNGFDKNFSDVFTDWTIASYINDCRKGEKYCYKNKHLNNIEVTPSSIFISPTREFDRNLAYFLEQWSGNWYRIIKGEGDYLTLEVDGADEANFELPYIACKSRGCTVNHLDLDSKQNGKLELSNFDDYQSLTLIPSIQEKQIDIEDKLKFGFSLSIDLKSEEERKTEELRQRVAELQARVDELLKKLKEQKQKYACSGINEDLHVGMENEKVKCLQQFLKDQEGIYPEGLVTSYFGTLTEQAVVRFQEQHKEQILGPWDLQNGTGYVGRTTKEKINEMIQ